jgi:hypothetical protein
MAPVGNYPRQSRVKSTTQDKDNTNLAQGSIRTRLDVDYPARSWTRTALLH